MEINECEVRCNFGLNNINAPHSPRRCNLLDLGNRAAQLEEKTVNQRRDSVAITIHLTALVGWIADRSDGVSMSVGTLAVS